MASHLLFFCTSSFYSLINSYLKVQTKQPSTFYLNFFPAHFPNSHWYKVWPLHFTWLKSCEYTEGIGALLVIITVKVVEGNNIFVLGNYNKMQSNIVVQHCVVCAV